MTANRLYPCRCCGYLTLDREPPATFDLCPICGWEDGDSVWIGLGSVWVSLREAQHHFVACGAFHPSWVGVTRPPTAADRRVADWRPLDEQIAERRPAAVREIAAAFADVRLDGGVTLHEADVIDGHGRGGTGLTMETARQRDPEVRWQEVAVEKLARFLNWGALSFLDARGFRFYLPAYMTALLESGESNQIDSGSLIFYLKLHYQHERAASEETLESRTREDSVQSLSGEQYQGMARYRLERISVLNAAQGRAIYGYLRFVADFGFVGLAGADALQANAAREAIASHWWRYAPDDDASLVSERSRGGQE